MCSNPGDGEEEAHKSKRDDSDTGGIDLEDIAFYDGINAFILLREKNEMSFAGKIEVAKKIRVGTIKKANNPKVKLMAFWVFFV